MPQPVLAYGDVAAVSIASGMKIWINLPRNTKRVLLGGWYAGRSVLPLVAI
ncbi:hypothetical protein KCP76_21210 [Salmonella enterica subsp. enterica serovar Weltevreden]|nr:hypothetical protein KCP76_21210 [Salmonella enterica subsp. enterica serovar Weltevreden]